ncbi:MAG: DUF5667 domain-containing protein [Dehalococcoidia bacterium]|nr:DUF5667 domain-containing protein [Dehalococcoidia bacterium]
MPQKIEDALNDCLDAILAGKTVEECLLQHPDHAEELRPLLEISLKMARAFSAIEPSPELRPSVMLRLDAAIQESSRRRPKRTLSPVRYPKLASAVTGICGLIIICLISINASTQSQPDDPLYPLKLGTEHVRLALTISEPARTELRLQLAERRINELAYLAGKGDTAAMDRVIRTLESNLGVLSDRPAEAATNAPETPTLRLTTEAAPSAPTVTEENKAAGGETASSPLAMSQAKALSVLEQVLKTAPEPARPAIHQAIIRVRDAYEQAMRKATQ